MEIAFRVTPETDGGYVAECLSHDIFTQGDTWEFAPMDTRIHVAALPARITGRSVLWKRSKASLIALPKQAQ